MSRDLVYKLKRPYHFIKTGLLRGLKARIKYNFPDKKELKFRIKIGYSNKKYEQLI